MNKIHEFFKKHDIDEKDIPKAFLLYKSLTVVIGVSVFTLCYKYQPIQNYMHQYPFNIITNGFKSRCPKIYDKIATTINSKTKAIADNKYFRPLPEFFKLEPERTTLALGETIIMRELITSITVPLKFFIVINWMKKRNQQINTKECLKDSICLIGTNKSFYSYFKN